MERFGRYLARWEAEAVARSFRARGFTKVGVKKVHETCYIVTYIATTGR